MCKAIEDMITDNRKEIAVRLLELNVLSNEKIAKCIGLDVEIINALEKMKNA